MGSDHVTSNADSTTSPLDNRKLVDDSPGGVRDETVAWLAERPRTLACRALLQVRNLEAGTSSGHQPTVSSSSSRSGSACS